MSDERVDSSGRESTASLTIMFAALVLLIVGGFLAGGIVVAYFEGEGADPESAAVLFLVGGCLVAIAVLLVRRHEDRS